jgi:hypothetical protein
MEMVWQLVDLLVGRVGQDEIGCQELSSEEPYCDLECIGMSPVLLEALCWRYGPPRWY